MKIRLQQPDRLILSGPPGGWGTVLLLLAVGTAMTAGGTLFVWHLWTAGETMPMLAAGVVGLFGVGALLGGIGTMVTRDRLELDRVTRSGRWTRRMLGWTLKRPIEFEFDRAREVTLSEYVDSSPDQRGASVLKVRARLYVTKPRRKIVLAEAERQNIARVRAVADAVAGMLGQAVVDKTNEPD